MSQRTEIGLAIVGCGTIGRIRAMLARDYPVLLGVLSLVSIALMLGNLVSDFLYVMIDPRIDFAK